jgi:hypothetical protein
LPERIRVDACSIDGLIIELEMNMGCSHLSCIHSFIHIHTCTPMLAAKP